MQHGNGRRRVVITGMGTLNPLGLVGAIAAGLRGAILLAACLALPAEFGGAACGLVHDAEQRRRVAGAGRRDEQTGFIFGDRELHRALAPGKKPRGTRAFACPARPGRVISPPGRAPRPIGRDVPKKWSRTDSRVPQR